MADVVVWGSLYGIMHGQKKEDRKCFPPLLNALSSVRDFTVQAHISSVCS